MKEKDNLEASTATIVSLLGVGHGLIVDLLVQMIAILQDDDLREANNRGVIKERAIKSYTLTMSINILEAYSNFLSELISISNYELALSNTLKEKLTDIEVNMLLERDHRLDEKTLSLKYKNGKYLSILSKIHITPRLLAKQFGKDVVLNKGSSEWQNIEKLKKLRDSIIHPRTDIKNIENFNKTPVDLQSINPTYRIDKNIIINGLGGIQWYFSKISELLNSIYSEFMSQSITKQMSFFMEAFILEFKTSFDGYE